MKKITLFFVLLVGVGLTGVQAQHCKKSAAACASKSTTVATSDKAHCGSSAMAAAQLASMDESIETRTDQSGSVSYVRKETNPETGAVIFTSVEYNSDLGKFVNLSPSAVKACSKGSKAGCCAKMKVTEASAADSKAKQVGQKGT
jgi:hypothetical protein